jgi:DNA transformation protein
MKTDDHFLRFVLDQLQDLPGLECRAMFGGHGLYSEEVFFGIIASGRLYFRTRPATRGRYVAQGMQPFRPNERQTLKNYYEVPVDVLEDHEELTAWAAEAVRGG